MKELIHDQNDEQKDEQKKTPSEPDSTEPDQDEITRSLKILVKLLIVAEREYQKGNNHEL